MSDNPYQSPADDTQPAERPSFRLRGYHVPFIIAVVCGTAIVVTAIKFPHEEIFVPACTALLMALIFDLALCVDIIQEWRRTGAPPTPLFDILGDPPETKAMHRAWKDRPQLDDDAFYQSFYADSAIAKEIVTSVRREMQSILEISLAGIHPGDDLETAAPELDFADVFYRLENDLNVVIPWRTGKIDFDFTFDSLVRLVANCMVAKVPRE